MKFERGKDIKTSLDIGIQRAIKKLISDTILGTMEGQKTLTRSDIAKEIETLTGWKEVKDITNYDYPHLFKFRFVNGNEIGVITINTKLDEI